jgi:uncharacterized protein involved in exopolysaccharide biosynthesis
MPVPLPSWNGGLPSGPEILQNPFDPVWLLHSLRRRWVLALGMGLLFGACLAGLVWMLVPPKYSAVAVMQVYSVSPTIMTETSGPRATRETDFEIFRQSQLALLKSHGVISAAVNYPQVAGLHSIRTATPDPIIWLQDELEVGYPMEGEYLQVVLSLDDAMEAQKIVQAIQEEYLKQVTNDEKRRRQDVLDKLSKHHQQVVDEIRREGEVYEALSKYLASSESDYASVEK